MACSSRTKEISPRGLFLSYPLGRALRIGDTESFLQEYDKCLQTLDESKEREGGGDKLEDIKELARNISDMSDSQYHIIEQGFHEGLLNDSKIPSLGSSLNDAIHFISTKLYTDSGICSDGDIDTRIDNNIIDKPVLPDCKSINGLYMYSNGDIVKVEKEIKQQRTSITSTTTIRQNYNNSKLSNHQNCVNYLWTNWCAVKKEMKIN